MKNDMALKWNYIIFHQISAIPTQESSPPSLRNQSLSLGPIVSLKEGP